MSEPEASGKPESPPLAKKALLALARSWFALLERRRRLMSGGPSAPPGRVYGFEARSPDGSLRRLSEYRGDVLVIANTASLCGFTPQYAGLEELQRRFRDRGLRVLAFPSNDFGSQEPGSDAEIGNFCRTRYSVSFEVFSKVQVTGEGAHPLFRFLTTESGLNGPIVWNFSKFLVGREGRVAARFGPETEPLSPKFLAAVTRLLEEPSDGGPGPAPRDASRGGAKGPGG